MKRMMRGMRSLVVALVCAVCGVVSAEDLAIQSFDGTGRLTFNELPTATVYRVEWAPTPAGPWTTFTGAAARLDAIQATGSGVVTCSVPMCYRVVATVTNAVPQIVPSGMVLVPGGSLTNIGNGAITVSSFYIGKYEITWAEWQTVRDWAATNGYDIGSIGAGSATNYPVQSVNWYDCVKWCNARSQKEGITPVYYTDASFTLIYKANEVLELFVNVATTGYRLPSDAEWEFAARGGTQSLGYEYSGGNDLNVVGWYENNSGGNDKAVGMKAANELGLYDMSGNVWEWCFDWDPENLGSRRVFRGGSWNYVANLCRLAFRGNLPPDYRNDACIGFRAVRNTP
jgi:formylglycine-generating enzyme required for sulfatase activity